MYLPQTDQLKFLTFSHVVDEQRELPFAQSGLIELYANDSRINSS